MITSGCIGQSAFTGSPGQIIHSERGNFYFKNYEAKQYNASFQNWGVLQDKDGIMVFANGDGVLTYDGKKWTLIETPTQSVIRSMAMDESGKIFVGALDDIGYLDKMKDGSLVYTSLLPVLKPELQAMGNIWSTHVHREFVYFEAETGLFVWNGERFRFWPWPDPARFHKSFFWKDELFVHEEGAGLLLFKGDKFELAPDGEFFKSMRIYSATPMGQSKIILGTRHEGLYTYDGIHVNVFPTTANQYLKSNQIYTGTRVSDSTFALGTRLGGVLLLDDRGNILSMINKENGLAANSVYALATDKNGDLWITLEKGISHFEINNGLSFYNEKTGLESAVNDICRYKERLYVTSTLGTFILRPASLPYGQARFEKIPITNAATGWNFLQIVGKLLISSNQGVFETDGSSFKKIIDQPSYAMHRFKADSNLIVIAHDNRLQILQLKNGKLESYGFVNDIKLDNIKFNETHPGKLWLTTYSQGAILLSFIKPDGSVSYDQPDVTHFGPDDGLPEGFIKMNSINGNEVFRVGIESKILKFDHSNNKFIPDPAFASRFGFTKEDVFPVSDQDRSGRFLMKTRVTEYGGRQLYVVIPSSKDTYRLQRFDMSRIFESVGVLTYVEKNDIIWHIGSGLVVRQELNATKPDTSALKTYLNKIVLSPDSVFFQGINGVVQHLTFPYSLNSFRFEFTSNNLRAEENNTFQYKLEGYEDNWSEWTTENIKEYSRLWEGSYTFSVRSRNYAGVVGKADAFSFVVAPPWFRSVYAYMTYVIAAVFFVWGLIRWRSHKLMLEKAALQAEIEHQTQEIRQQNIQLEEQSEELKVNAEQLKELDKMKSNFFINISHEFRTPLSLILGPLEKYIQENESGQIRLAELERMHRNARRLQQLINQLLDLAKLESGGVKLNDTRTDFIYFVRVLTASFESLAEIRNIRYEVDIPPHAYETFFDSEKVETVLYNLLSNAFKFTPDGGSIHFRVKLPAENTTDMVCISISDSGPGIAPEEVDKIFDRFYQVDSSSSREFEGSGIGLSLVKELVSLMKGRIEVSSELKKGSTFNVSLPLKGIFLGSSLEPTSGLEAQLTENLPAYTLSTLKEKETLSEGDENSESLVLLIEDNEDLRNYLKENLEGDYKIIVAENGKVGLEKAYELTPDLILSDMMMPIMDGFTLCTKIREDERTSHIPFILLTARTTIESKLEGLELGADEYMTKPFNIKEIKVRMKNLLEQRKNLRKSYSREITLQPKNISVTSVDERFLNHALAIMEAHIADEQFSVERFAEEIGMSRKNLLRKIKALTDQSVNEFIRNFRLKRAAQLIDGKSATVSEVAYQVGFNNLSYFSKCFKELFGVLPNEYASGKAPVS
ncbi:MAG: hypothetical protein C0490_02825 [Marivirga sp.]|nr:hypothetical protein [Marivirga sp.]